MKYIIGLIIFCIYQPLLSQNVVPYQDYKTTLWGLKDSKNNKNITKPLYSKISVISKGFLVYKDKKQGLYNPDGKEVLSPIYNQINFTKQQVILKSDNQYGVMDSNYSTVIPIQYDMIKLTDNLYYTVSKNGLKGLMDISGKLLIPIEYESFNAFHDGYSIAVKTIDHQKVFGVIHISNTEVLPFIYPNIKTYKAYFFYQIKEKEKKFKSNGMVVNQTPSNHPDIGKVFNRKGKEVNLDIYNRFQIRKTNLIKVSSIIEPKKFGFINRYGTLKIPILYDYSTDFLNGSAVVSITKGSKTKFGIIDSLHNTYAFGQFDHISYPHNKTAIVYNGTYTKVGNQYVLKKGKYGLIDMKGNILIPVEYDVLSNLYNHTLFKAHRGKTDDLGKPINPTYNIINSTGNIVNKQPYIHISNFKNGCSKVFIGRIKKGSYNKKIFDGKFGFIDTLGNEILSVEYDNLEEMNRAGYAVVMKKYNNKGKLKQGLINSKGELVVPVQYDYFNGKSLAFIGTLNERGRPDKGKYGVINSSTGHCSKVIYDRIDKNIASYRVEDNNQVKDQYVLLSPNGTETSDKTYDYIIPLNKDYIKVFKVSEENNIKIGKYGIVDAYGKEVIPVMFTNIELTNTHFKVRQMVDL